MTTERHTCEILQIVEQDHVVFSKASDAKSGLSESLALLSWGVTFHAHDCWSEFWICSAKNTSSLHHRSWSLAKEVFNMEKTQSNNFRLLCLNAALVPNTTIGMVCLLSWVYVQLSYILLFYQMLLSKNMMMHMIRWMPDLVNPSTPSQDDYRRPEVD